MSNDTPDGPPPASETPTAQSSTPPPATPPPAAPPESPESPRDDRRWTPTALPTALVALGVGLLAGGVAVAAAYSRDGAEGGDLDLTAFIAGCAGAGVLLLLGAVAAVAALRGGKDRGVDARGVAGWAGPVGILAAALMLGIGLEDVPGLAYLLGAVVTVLSVVGYVVARHGGFVVTAIAGLAVLYVEGFRDLYGEVGLDDLVARVALALGVFVLAVTLLGWLLPTRVLSAQVVGWVGVVGSAALLGAIAILQVVSAFFDDLFGGLGDLFGGDDWGMFFESDSPFGGTEGAEEAPGLGGELGIPGLTGDLPDFTGDVWAVLTVAGVLMLVWLLAAAVTKHPGFTLLAVAMPVATVPLATVALAADRPTVWAVALLVPGAVVLGGTALLAVRRR